jgi:membrane fusion protein, multidrug efflux system
MRKALIIVAIVAVLAVLAFTAGQRLGWEGLRLGGISAQQRGKDARARAPRAVPVETVSARAVTTSSDIRAIGGLRSDESVKIAPEIAGRVAEIVFREGEAVKQGEALVRLDTSLAQAEIDDAQARFELAKANYDRANQLARTGNITERAQDEARSTFQTAQAALELARVRLAKHTLKAPFSGVVGFRNVSPGAFVNVGAEIVNLVKIDVLKVDFKIPEIYLAHVKVGQDVAVTVDAFPERTFTGTIYAIDPQVDVNGRALNIRARLPNPDNLLRPGLFARIIIKGPSRENVVSVPESAVVPRGGETFMFLVQDGKAVETRVRLGQRKAGEVEVLDGLPAGATVVTTGHQRLRDGSSVDVVTSAGAGTRG